MREHYLLGVFRWRGAWNFKDITERIISGFVAGTSAGSTFWILDKLLGG